MTITNGYTTLTKLRAKLQFTSTDTADDSMLEAVVTAVSRLIDNYTGRRFFSTTADETRYYTAEFADLLLCPDDIISITTLATDADGDRTYESTWTASDYDLEPYNAALDGAPYTRIAVMPSGGHGFPAGVAKGIKIVGKFGYAATTPSPVEEACLLQCERVYKRKDAVFGVIGSAEMGQTMVIPKLDPDVQLMLSGYQRVRVGAA